MHVAFEDLGEIDYQAAWDYQDDLFQRVVERKMAIRKSEAPTGLPTPENFLLFCSHPHVYTLGKSGKMDHLLLSEDQMSDQQISFYKINRGGDITYHGPGQLVGYPILDLEQLYTDIHKYLRELEEAIILTLDEYGIKGERYPGYTGVWLDADNDKARKICAMGVRCSRWVTMHGFAFNVNSNLDYFNNIIPCGIDDKAVTSMHTELGRRLDEEEVKGKLKANLAKVFNWTYAE